MKQPILRFLAVLLPLFGTIACGGAESDDEADSAPPNLDAALASITAKDLVAHIRVLSSDAYEGRAPSKTAG